MKYNSHIPILSFTGNKIYLYWSRQQRASVVRHIMQSGMLEGMQMVPSFNDAVWKALLPPAQIPFYGSRLPPSVVSRPCLASSSSTKPEVVTSEVVRRALYSAALDFMSSGHRLQRNQPRLQGFPQHHQHLRHHHHHRQQQQQQHPQTYGELIQHHHSPLQSPSDNRRYLHQHPVTSLMTSPLSEDGVCK